MIGNFDIKDSNQNFSYPHHLIHTDILREIADYFDLELSIPINQGPTQYIDNSNESNLAIDLIFLCTNSKKFNNYSILSNLQYLSDHVFLIVDIIINKEFIQIKY